MSKLEGLGWSQIVALRTLRDTPDIEGSDLCRRADMSFDELFSLADRGLIDIGKERIRQNALHPVLLDVGLLALDEAIKGGFIDA
jgi:hypothetical protein